MNKIPTIACLAAALLLCSAAISDPFDDDPTGAQRDPDSAIGKKAS